jgi:hypothetical protein
VLFRSPGSNTNRNTETGIRYGVIGQNSVNPDVFNDIEYEYAGPNCPKCGDDAITIDENGQLSSGYHLNDLGDDWDVIGSEYACHRCKWTFDSDEAFGDESIGFTYDQDGYKLTDCLDTDIFVIESPYYTFAPFCSPCVPGAGNLDNAMPTGIKTYCLGHDWFDDQIAPYPVFRVSDDVQIIAKHETVDCTYCHGTGKRTVDSNMSPNLGTIGDSVDCWVCNGAGKRDVVIETEQDNA